MRWIFRLLGTLVVLGIALTAVLFSLPIDSMSRIAADKLSAATGYDVWIGGDLTPTLWPVFGVTLGKVSLVNPDDPDALPPFQAEKLSIAVDPLSLFSDSYVITGLDVDGATLILAPSVGGLPSWPMGGSGAGQTVAGLELKRIDLRNSVVFMGAGADAKPLAEGLDLALTVTGTDAVAQFEGQRNGQAFGGDAHSSDLPRLFAGEGPLVATLRSGDSALLFEGNLDIGHLAANGALRIEIADHAVVSGLTGLPIPDLPQGLGRDRISLQGRLDFRNARADLLDLTANLDQNHFSGSASAEFRDRPLFVASLTSGPLDLSVLTLDGTAQADWSQATLPTDRLGAFDLTLDVNFPSAMVGTTQTGAGDIRLAIDNAITQIDLRGLSIFDGVISGQFAADLRGEPAIRVDLQAKTISTAQVGRAFLDSDRLRALFDGQVLVAGRGATLDALMHSLEGRGQFELSEGQITGLDLVGFLRGTNFTATDTTNSTLFDRLRATFTISKGILANEDFKISAPLVTTTGGGKIDLGDKKLDLNALIVMPEGIADQEVRLPMTLTGPWSAPVFVADIGRLLAVRIDPQLANLDATALEIVRARLEGELGITIDPKADLRATIAEALQVRTGEILGSALGFGPDKAAPAAEVVPTPAEGNGASEPAPVDPPTNPAAPSNPQAQVSSPDPSAAPETGGSPETSPAPGDGVLVPGLPEQPPVPAAETAPRPADAPDPLALPAGEDTGSGRPTAPDSSLIPLPRPSGDATETDTGVETEITPDPGPAEGLAVTEPGRVDPAAATPAVEPTPEGDGASSNLPASAPVPCPDIIDGNTPLPCILPGGELLQP